MTSILHGSDLSKDQKEEILNALTIGEIPVRNSMTDLDNIVFLSTTRSVGENLERIGENIHTRYPLICDEPESFLGISYVPGVVDMIDELRNGDLTFEDIAVPPMTIDETASLSQMLG